ncbi:MAG TPA: tellurium resistance protein TehB [Rhodobacteraceae bacterium]|jgi:SAM-dependent methyltransferase|nr:tellurium resistance protein TehB [Paracoccaceae bacterium]
MAESDRKKWDAKYSDTNHQIEHGEASYMLKQYHGQVTGKRALDVACGTGRNALFLAALGFHVDALDISSVGLKRLAEAAVGLSGQVDTRVVDLDGFSPPVETYDLIVVTNYLNRPLIPKLGASLLAGGILVMDTFMLDQRNEVTHYNPDYLLKKSEFTEYFQTGYQILKFEEYCVKNSGCGMWKQAIAVRKLG